MAWDFLKEQDENVIAPVGSYGLGTLYTPSQRGQVRRSNAQTTQPQTLFSPPVNQDNTTASGGGSDRSDFSTTEVGVDPYGASLQSGYTTTPYGYEAKPSTTSAVAVAQKDATNIGYVSTLFGALGGPIGSAIGYAAKTYGQSRVASAVSNQVTQTYTGKAAEEDVGMFDTVGYNVSSFFGSIGSFFGGQGPYDGLTNARGEALSTGEKQGISQGMLNAKMGVNSLSMSAATQAYNAGALRGDKAEAKKTTLSLLESYGVTLYDETPTLFGVGTGYGNWGSAMGFGSYAQQGPYSSPAIANAISSVRSNSFLSGFGLGLTNSSGGGNTSGQNAISVYGMYTVTAGVGGGANISGGVYGLGRSIGYNDRVALGVEKTNMTDEDVANELGKQRDAEDRAAASESSGGRGYAGSPGYGQGNWAGEDYGGGGSSSSSDGVDGTSSGGANDATGTDG